MAHSLLAHLFPRIKGSQEDVVTYRQRIYEYVYTRYRVAA